MNSEAIAVRVWDIPTRFFHWATVLLLVALWWSADAGEMQYHQLLAYSLMILVVFRLCWGVVGSETARFSHFIRGPRTAIAYVRQAKRREAASHVGHNPLGGYMVIALLLLLVIQLVTGLFATDEVFTEGPFYSYVSGELAEGLTWLHKQNFDVMLVLIAVHILAVMVHGLLGDKLLPAMWHGKKQLPVNLVAPLEFKSLRKALAIMLSVGALVAYYFIWPLMQGL
jgi:cytochrome b